MITQPQGNTQNPSNTPLKEVVTEGEVINSGEISASTAPSQSSIMNNDTPEIQIRKKAQYRSFMKLIKEKKYTTAVMTSKILGVERNTLTSWLQTKKVRELMQSTYNGYIDDISTSKDWKAKAYLLDKLEDKDAIKDTAVNINNLIQVNTVAPSQPKQGTVTI